MQQQLSRILKTDFCKVDNLLSERIDKFDHLKQTLTERTKFLFDFQQMIKKQIAQTHRVSRSESPPQIESQNILIDQYNHIRRVPKLALQDLTNNQYVQGIIQSKCVTNYANQNVQCSQSSIFYNQTLEIKKKQNKHTQTRSDKSTLRISKQMKELKNQINTMKNLFLQNMEKYMISLSSDCTQIVKNIYNTMTRIYESKISQLNLLNDQLKYQIVKLQKQIKKQHKQSPPFIESTVPQKLQIEKSKIQINYSLSKKLDTIFLNKSQQQQSTGTNILQVKRQKQQTISIPIKDNIYLSNIINNFQQKKTKQNQKQSHKNFTNKLNAISTISLNPQQNYFSLNESYKLIIQKNNEQNKDPHFPLILQRNSNNYCSFDIPQIRSIIVAEPPITNGYCNCSISTDINIKGMWKNGKLEGMGKINTSFYTYEGNFKEGCFDGKGTLTIPSLNLHFIGEFKNNEANGEGVLKIGHKISIIGEWRNNFLFRKF